MSNGFFVTFKDIFGQKIKVTGVVCKHTKTTYREKKNKRKKENSYCTSGHGSFFQLEQMDLCELYLRFFDA